MTRPCLPPLNWFMLPGPWGNWLSNPGPGGYRSFPRNYNNGHFLDIRISVLFWIYGYKLFPGYMDIFNFLDIWIYIGHSLDIWIYLISLNNEYILVISWIYSLQILDIMTLVISWTSMDFGCFMNIDYFLDDMLISSGI